MRTRRRNHRVTAALRTRDDTVPTQPPTPVVKLLPNIVVTSYNIRIDMDPRPHRWADRCRAVIATIKSCHPSIICLQEVTQRALANIVKALPTFLPLGCQRSESSDESNPILVDTRSWKVLGYDTFVMRHGGLRQCYQGRCTGTTQFFNPASVANHPRIITHARLQHGPHTIINVLNTHYPLASEVQHRCSEVISQYMSTLTGTIILCGDFNSHQGAVAFNTTIPRLLALTDFSDAHMGDDTPTFGTFHELHRTGRKIDYILSNIKSMSAHIIDARYGPQRYRPSDHSCISATFFMQ
jgi:endonuclease/exonuclease/phosphatase family metal-dependent hydrolase